MDFKKLIEKYFKSSRNLMYYMVIAVLLGVLFMIAGSAVSNMNTSRKNDEKKNAIEVSTNSAALGAPASYEEKLRRELVEVLGKIKGVGKVDIVIKFEEDIEEIPAKDIDNSQEKVEEKDNNGGTRVTTRENSNEKVVVVNDGSAGGKVVMLRRINPKIGGVIVVAEGAENRELRMELVRAVKTVLNIPDYKVSIHSMK